MHARSDWQAERNQTTSAPRSDTHAAASLVQPWQQTMAATTQQAQPHFSPYIPFNQHHTSRQNTALNYLDFAAQSYHNDQSTISPSTRLSNQFAALASDQAPRHEASQPYSAIASLGYSDDDVEEEDADLDADVDVEETGADGVHSDARMSTAERVAQKRRMKRFRLTHEQTRFLINEFIRQPHPDAAHRERLSKEIPGLSPRQVQVWFQNRRAKMKRLPPEDRARILDSRMLPDHFDTNAASHPTANSTEPQNTGDWMQNPGTSIRSMDHLQQMFAEGVDSISNRERSQQQDRILSGIESIISTNAYPSPVASGRSNSVSNCDFDRRWQETQLALQRSNTNEQIKAHNAVDYLGSEMYPTAPRPRNWPEAAAAYGRRTSLPAHRQHTQRATKDGKEHDVNYNEQQQ